MIQLTVRGENVEVTQALYEYAELKLEKLERFFNHPLSNVRVKFKVFKSGQKAEVTFPVMGVTLRAEETSDDLYASIDKVVDKLEKQIRKHKTKIKRRYSHRKTQSDDNYFHTEEHEEAQSNESDHEIVRTKTFFLKPMNVDEAILQMEMLGHQFFLFIDAETNERSVVYKKKRWRFCIN